MSTHLKTLHHVGIVVQDLDASVAWYARCLGFERLSEYSFPGARVAFIGLGDLQLELFQTEGAAPMAAEREAPATNLKIGGVNHFAIAVDDIDAAVEELRSKGVEIVSPPALVPNGRSDRFAFVRDNERMLIELFEQTP